MAERGEVWVCAEGSREAVKYLGAVVAAKRWPESGASTPEQSPTPGPAPPNEKARRWRLKGVYSEGKKGACLSMKASSPSRRRPCQPDSSAHLWQGPGMRT